jgi:hypothetical protein
MEIYDSACHAPANQQNTLQPHGLATIHQILHPCNIHWNLRSMRDESFYKQITTYEAFYEINKATRTTSDY